MTEKQDFSHETLPALGKRARVLIEKGDQAQGKANDFYVSAGLHLIEAKDRCAAQGLKWGEFLIEHQITRTTAHRHMQIAGWSPIDVAKAREENATRMRNDRAKKKTSGNGGRSARAEQTRSTDNPAEFVKSVRRDPLAEKRQVCITLIEQMDAKQLDEAIKLLRKIK